MPSRTLMNTVELTNLIAAGNKLRSDYGNFSEWLFELRLALRTVEIETNSDFTFNFPKDDSVDPGDEQIDWESHASNKALRSAVTLGIFRTLSKGPALDSSIKFKDIPDVSPTRLLRFLKHKHVESDGFDDRRNSHY